MEHFTNNAQNNTPKDTSIDPTRSYETGVWNNLKIIFQQQIPQYMTSVEQNGGSRTINDLNGFLQFLENTINNSLSAFIKQRISISKLKQISQPRIRGQRNISPTNQNEVPFTVTNNVQGESKSYKSKIRLTESQLHRLIKESVKRVLNEGGYYKPWWDSKYQYWHTKEDGDCDYVDFDYMSDEEIKKEYDDVLEWFRHVPCNKMACHSPDIYAKLKALEAEMEERGLS